MPEDELTTHLEICDPAAVDVPQMTALLFESFADKICPAFGRRLEAGKKLVAEEYLLPEGLSHALVARVGGEVVGVLHYVTSPPVGDTARVFKRMVKHLGWIYAVRAALILSYLEPHYEPDGCHISHVCVDPKLRRRKIGLALMNEAHKRALDQGKKWATLYVAEENTGAVRLYQNMGYVTERKASGFVCRYVLKVKRFLFMRKKLSENST